MHRRSRQRPLMRFACGKLVSTHQEGNFKPYQPPPTLRRSTKKVLYPFFFIITPNIMSKRQPTGQVVYFQKQKFDDQMTNLLPLIKIDYTLFFYIRNRVSQVRGLEFFIKTELLFSKCSLFSKRNVGKESYINPKSKRHNIG